MPALICPNSPGLVSLPPRTAQLAAETDVLVVGGGPAGLGAALGADNAGAGVILTERYGFLGGNVTAALVMPLMSFHTQSLRREKKATTTLLPTDHGPASGWSRERRRRSSSVWSERRSDIAFSKRDMWGAFDPEVSKLVALDVSDERGSALYSTHLRATSSATMA